MRFRVGPMNVKRAIFLQEASKEPSDEILEKISWSSYIILTVYRYYRALLSDSEVWGPTVEIRSKHFLKRLNGVTTWFLVSVATGFAVLGNFLSPSLVAWVSLWCLVLVPVIYWTLGKAWYRFCEYLAQATCLMQQLHKENIMSQSRKSWRKRDIIFICFVTIQIGLTVASFAVSLLNTISESKVFSLLIGLGCFVSLTLVSIGTHGVGGKLKNNYFRFYQPFEGGLLFCVLQASSWILFSLSFLLIGLHSSCMFLCIIGRCSMCMLGTFTSMPLPSGTVDSVVSGTSDILIPATSTVRAGPLTNIFYSRGFALHLQSRKHFVFKVRYICSIFFSPVTGRCRRNLTCDISYRISISHRDGEQGKANFATGIRNRKYIRRDE